MENAAKAILIAGGVLIAILLLTLFSYLFRQMGEDTADIYTTLEQSEIAEFNQKFLNYDWKVTGEGKALSVQDVATLISLTLEGNNKYNYRNKNFYRGVYW